MLGSWLLTRAVYLFGALLVLLGLMFISMGVPIVRLEIGWTEVIGGSVAASAGCVILVMGTFLGRLVAIQRTLERLIPAPVTEVEMPFAAPLADPAPVPTPPAFGSHPLAPVAHRDYTVTEVEAVRPEPPLAATLHPDPDLGPEPEPVVAMPVPALRESAPALAAAEQAELSKPQAPAVEIEGEADNGRSRPGFLSSVLARRLKPPAAPERQRVEPVQEPMFAPSPDGLGSATRRTPIDLSSGWENEEPDNYAPPPLRGTQSPAPEPQEPAITRAEPPRLEPVPVETPVVHEPEPVHAIAPEPERVVENAPLMAEAPATAPEEDAALQPVVVGRYNAGSASYVMYSNGMIEVETEQGTHQFASMAELKAFIERRDARVS